MATMTDAFASAPLVTTGVNVAPGTSTSTYTTETSEPLTMPVARTGWCKFTPATSGSYTFDTIQSTFDTGIAVYSGTALASLTLVGSDNNSGGSTSSSVTVTLTGGTTYYVQVGSGTGTVGGTVVLNISAVSGVTGWLYKGRSSHTQDALTGG